MATRESDSATSLARTTYDEPAAKRPRYERWDDDFLHVRDLPTYYGHTIEEAQAFISGAERRFRMLGGTWRDQEKIDYCVVALDKKLERRWSFYESDSTQELSWGIFKTWLADVVIDSYSRRVRAAIEYEEARQEAGEKVDDFAIRLATLEKELEYNESGDSRRRADTLFVKLRPKLKSQILYAEDLSTTREAILQLARRMEQVEKIESG